MLTPRSRMNMTLLHKEPDRPPMDLGSTPNTSITKVAYQRLVDYLGLKLGHEPKVIHVPFQLVELDELVLEILRIDTRPMFTNPPNDPQVGFLPDGRYKDEWGVIYRPVRSHGVVLYYDIIENPLSTAVSIRDIEKHSWPNPDEPARYNGLYAKAKKLRETTDYAIVGHPGFTTSIFQTACALRGFANFLIDLIKNKDFAHALLQKILEIQSRRMECYLSEVGEFIDVVCVGDDFCHQAGPFISLDLFREMLLPYLKRYFEIIKNHTRAKLHLHSCGAIHYVLDDLIDIGVDIINPVQLSAKGMDPEKLKQRFGSRVVFWGGIDTQKVLPYGRPEEVRREVRRVIQILGKGGGYVLSAVHNIQADVPPENIIAIFDKMYKYKNEKLCNW